LALGRIEGVKRGCIATVIPRQSNEFVLLRRAGVERWSAKPFHLRAHLPVMG